MGRPDAVAILGGILGRDEVQTWVTKLGDSLAPSSVRKIHVVFSGLMKNAVQDRRIPPQSV